MKVYTFRYIGSYGGGLTLVAANNQEEAMNVFVEENSYCLGRNDVKCEVMSNVLATVDKPCLLDENFYIE